MQGLEPDAQTLWPIIFPLLRVHIFSSSRVQMQEWAQRQC